MKTPSPKLPPPSRESARSFTWGVRSTEISFMRADEAGAAMEGSGWNCQDCSAIAPFDRPRPRRPETGGGNGGNA
jgi:hypothetical protein